MRLAKRVILVLFVAGLLLQASVCGSQAKQYPVKPIKMLVHASAGGTTDVSMRVVAKVASEYLGQPIVIQNTPGAGGAVALSTLAKAAPDGYTFSTVSGTPAIAMPLVQDVPYDILKDFVMVAQYTTYQEAVAVHVDSPWKTWDQFWEYARKNPGRITYGTTGATGAMRMIMEMMAKQEGAKVTLVPFDGGAPAFAAVLGRHIDSAIGAEFAAGARDGKLRLLAVIADNRLPDYPDVPTAQELDVDIPDMFMVGILAPKGTPADIAATVADAFRKALEDPGVTKAIEQLQMIPKFRNGEDLRAMIIRATDQLRPIVEELGLAKK